MRRFTMALGVMAAVLLVAGVSAQNKKDFSGKWILDAEKSGGATANAAPGRGRGGQASPIEVRMDSKTLVVITTRTGQDGTVTTATSTYNLDGSDSKNMGGNRAAGAGGAADQISNAKWDGDKLVITIKDSGNKVSYWLDGANLVRESLNAAPGRDGAPPTPQRTYFKKAS